MKKFGIEPDSLCMAYMAALHAASADITKLQVFSLNENSC